MAFLLLTLLLISCTGCFRRWIMTDKEVRNYYSNKPVKPVFFTIRNDSVQLFCATTGSDTLPPLIMIHGAPGSWPGSRNFLDDSILQQHFHLIAIDRPGYGKSRFGKKRTVVNSLCRQAVAIHEALRVNRSFKKGIVMGNSYGAPIAAKMAMMYPDDFYLLIMMAPAIDPTLEKFWWFHPYLKSGLLIQLMPHFIRIATAEKFGHVRELQKLDTQWNRLHIPAVVVQGGRDHIIYPANLSYARRVLGNPADEFIYLPNAGHLLRRQNADTIRAILMRHTQPGKPKQH